MNTCLNGRYDFRQGVRFFSFRLVLLKLPLFSDVSPRQSKITKIVFKEYERGLKVLIFMLGNNVMAVTKFQSGKCEVAWVKRGNEVTWANLTFSLLYPLEKQVPNLVALNSFSVTLLSFLIGCQTVPLNLRWKTTKQKDFQKWISFLFSYFCKNCSPTNL